MKIAHIMPVNASKERKEKVLKKLKQVVHSNTEIDIIDYKDGPVDLEYYEDDLKAVQLMMADRERLAQYDGINIACFYDPGLRELREVLENPVMGIGFASMTVANMLGSKSTVIVGRDKWIPKMSDNSLIYGLNKNVTNWRSVGLSVHQLKSEKKLTRERILEQTRLAIEEDLAEVIIMGCAAIDNIEQEIEEKFGVPAVNPIIAGITITETLAQLRLKNNLSHSKKYDYAMRVQ
ncbi:aspartate/glutamate racemase family protein [Pseudogracilibacillus sp. SO30301A]|uniref:aspartate/glutamate racemase family protein n=1 Tax=Pseudogracilibacillus sp. SO30301A TaxID=3098291 RepID=UPI00300DE290